MTSAADIVMYIDRVLVIAMSTACFCLEDSNQVPHQCPLHMVSHSINCRVKNSCWHVVGQWWHHDVDKGLTMLYRCAQARREEPTEGRASPNNAEGTESRKRRKPRSWLDTASPPPKEDAREPVASRRCDRSMASTARRGGARRRSHGWTTGKRRRRRTPSPDLEPDAVEEEVEEYLRRKWIPGDDRLDWTAGDWWRAHKDQFPHIEKLARHFLATQVTCSTLL